MKQKLLETIERLNEILTDIEKVEDKSYGYKAAAVRARKALHETKGVCQDLRKEIQAKKTKNSYIFHLTNALRGVILYVMLLGAFCCLAFVC